MNIKETDVLIIGAGPVGLFAIFEAGMLKMKTIMVDSLDFVGGQCTALYPEKPIYDIPAFPSIDAQDLIANLEKQAAPFNPEYMLGQSVQKLERKDGHFIATTSQNNVIKARAIIIAAGAGAFGPNRPPIEGLEEFEEKSIFYMVKRKKDFENKDVVIAGGGDSAVDWAISLSEIANSVTIVHRRAKFRCAPESHQKLLDLASNGKVKMEIGYQLESLKGQSGNLSEVVVKDLESNCKSLKADVLLPFFGLAMELGPIADWGIEIEKKHLKVTPHDMQTDLPGVFAIGDIATYQGKLKLILNGFAEAAMACHAIYPLVNEGKALHFEYSTTKGIKKENA